jgi:acetyl/propionyl-CoA carboxylase alpha subunit
VPFSKVLVANRGEIAIRVFRTLRELGISPIAVYSEADRGSPHVAYADEAFLLGPGGPDETYLAAERIVGVARRAGAGALHPGYGFLAENASFARLVAEAGIAWIGPPPEAIEAMGSKIAARERMRAAGVPIVPGTTEPLGSVEQLVRFGEELGWPLALKASAGGGGKGLKVVRNPDEAERALESARREGAAYFADDTVYIEGTSRTLAMSRHRSWQMRTGTSSFWASATARSSAVTRSSSRKPLLPPSTTRFARGSARSPLLPRGRSATGARAQSKGCSRLRASGSSSK